MDLLKLSEGTVVTLKSTHSNERDIYIVLSRVEMKKGQIFLFDKFVLSFKADGTYNCANHFKDPYVFTVEEFKKRVQLTNVATVKKILNFFKQDTNPINNFPSMKELRKKANVPLSYDQMMKNVKHIEALENGPWKEEVAEIKEFEEHYYNKGFRDGFVAGQLNTEYVHSETEVPKDDPEEPFFDERW